tara:strand:+ start:73 stop:270 length:198 start_codon:yes stop_codon:yes gene_type:complete
MSGIDTYLKEEANILKNYIPKNIDIHTTNAKLNHTNLDVKSINIQTIILSIILVIFITMALIVHL